MKWNIFSIIIFFAFSTQAQLNKSLDRIIAQEFPPEAEIGIAVVNSNGQLIYGHHADQNMIPASLQKIITNFTALEVLGPNYIYNTTIGYNGLLSPDGTLNGDIIIFGNGDPSLASERFQKRPQLNQVVSDIANFIEKKGITCIDGEIIVDASYFGTDGNVHSWPWEDIGNYYGASIWSVNIHENYYNLYFQLSTTRTKPPQIISYSPAIPGIILHNELSTGPEGSGDQAYIFGAPYTSEKYIRGSLPSGKGTYKIKGAIPDSPSYFGFLIASELAKRNISSMGYKAEYNKQQKIESKVAQIKSPELQDLVKSANLESINLYCEAFLLSLGAGERAEGITNVKIFLANNNIDTTDINIVDGSGLSFWNYLSAEDFAKLIHSLQKEYKKDLAAFFPEAGVSGTLSYMFKNSPAIGNLWAKTGSMNQVMNYAGFTKSKSGNNLSFCIMVNRHKVENRTIRRIEEKIMETIFLEG